MPLSNNISNRKICSNKLLLCLTTKETKYNKKNCIESFFNCYDKTYKKKILYTPLKKN